MWPIQRNRVLSPITRLFGVMGVACSGPIAEVFMGAGESNKARPHQPHCARLSLLLGYWPVYSVAEI